MTTPEARDPVTTAENLTAALDGMGRELQRLGAYGKRNRKLIITVLISLTLDIILTVAVTFLAIQAHDTSVRAASTAASNLALCQSNNVSRAATINLWEYALSLSSGPKTGAQRAARAKFDAYLRHLYAPRDCQHLSTKG